MRKVKVMSEGGNRHQRRAQQSHVKRQIRRDNRATEAFKERVMSDTKNEIKDVSELDDWAIVMTSGACFLGKVQEDRFLKPAYFLNRSLAVKPGTTQAAIQCLVTCILLYPELDSLDPIPENAIVFPVSKLAEEDRKELIFKINQAESNNAAQRAVRAGIQPATRIIMPPQ